MGWESKQDNSKVGAMLNRKVSKKTVVAIGTMRAGKTTHFAGLGATAQFKVNDSNGTFRFIPREETTNLLDDIAELKAGHFPEATKIVTGTTVKPSFLFEWEDSTLLGNRFNVIRQADMPIIDYAGEQLVGLQKRIKAARTFEQASAIQGSEQIDQLTVTVNQASALLLIINATRAEGLPIFKPEPYQKIPGMSKHPDVNMQRIIGPILELKRLNADFNPPLERIGVVFTACDVLFPIAKTIENFTGRPFDPLNPEISEQSLSDFMKAFFTGTLSLLSSLNVKVQYFPSYFELEKINGQTQYWNPEEPDEEKREPKIKRGNIFDSPDWVHNVNRPKYTEYWFNREIEWLKEFATRV